MLEVSNVKLPLDAGLPGAAAEALVRAAAAAALGVAGRDVRAVRVLKRSVDARTAEIEVMLTMAPPCSRISGTAARVQRNGPVRLTSRIRCQSVSVVSMIGAKRATPALLTSASRRPNRRVMRSSASATMAASETSQCSASVRSGHRREDVALSSSCCSMSSRATRQPSWRNRLAVASPMPRAAPVIKATLSFGIAVGASVTVVGSFGRWPGSWLL